MSGNNIDLPGELEEYYFAMLDRVDSQEIALTAVHVLVDTFGGRRPYIPTQKKQRINERNQSIVDLAEAGISYRTLAELYKISDRSVRRIVSRRTRFA